MAIDNSLENALRTLILSLSSVAAMSPLPTVRPYKIAQVDFKADTGATAVVVEAPENEHQVSLDGLGGGVNSKALVTAVSEEFDAAWTLAEKIRTNGTSPSTGLSGYVGSVSGVKMSIAVDSTSKGFVPYEDGSDEGYYFVRRHLTIGYIEST